MLKTVAFSRSSCVVIIVYFTADAASALCCTALVVLCNKNRVGKTNHTEVLTILFSFRRLHLLYTENADDDNV